MLYKIEIKTKQNIRPKTISMFEKNNIFIRNFQDV